MLARRFIKHVEPRVIFVCKDKLVTLQKAAEIENHECQIIILDNEDDGDQSFNNILNASPSDEMENFQVTKDISCESLCELAPTSGSTGIPKFVSRSHAKMLQRLPQKINDNPASNEKNITLMRILPEWEVHPIKTLLLLVSKSTKIFLNTSDPIEMARIIEKYKVNCHKQLNFEMIKLHLNNSVFWSYQVNHLVMSTYRASSYSHADKASKYNLDSVLTITTMGGVLPTKAMQKINTLFPNACIYKILGKN